MATTFVEYTGDGQASKQFTFPSYQESDVKVRVDGVLKTTSTHYNITNYTTTGGGNVVFTSGNIPSSPAKIRIYRDTSVDVAKATFTAGSSVKAADLNNNTTQLLYRAQEEQVPNLIQSYDIAASAIETSNIKDSNVTTAKIADNAVTMAKLNSGTLPTDITVASANIVDGTIVEADIANSAVTQNKLANNSVGTPELINGSVTTDKIANDNVTLAKLGGGALPTDITVASANIVNGTITTADIGADQITNALIADNQIDSEHYVDGSIDREHLEADIIDSTKLADDAVGTEHIQTNAVVTGTIATNAVTRGKILDGEVIRSKIAADAIDSSKIADDAIDSEHIGNGAINSSAMLSDNVVTTAKIANNAVTTDKIPNLNVTTSKIAHDAINSNKIADGAVITAAIANNAVTSDKIATNAITTSKLAANAVGTARIADDAVTQDKLADNSVGGNQLKSNAVSTDKIAGGNVTTGKIADGAVATAKIADDAVTNAKIADGTLDGRYFTETELLNGALDGRYFTETEADARYFNVSTGDTIKDGDTFPDNDTTIATTAAINDRIIDLVEEVGGFVAIANETSFPTANPDVNNGTGTIVSVKAASTNLAPSGTTVTISNGAGSGNTVTITGVTATIPSGFGFLVETTTTLHTYTFHRLVPVATQVETVANNITNIVNAGSNTNNINTVAGNSSNITTVAGISGNVTTVANNDSNVTTVANNISSVNNFASQYRVGSSNPTTSLDVGDLFFNTTANELKVYNGSAWQGGVTATGNFATVTGNTFTGSNNHNDNVKSIYGTGSDLEIFHTGSQSTIQSNNVDNLTLRQQYGGGYLFIHGDNVHLRSQSTNELYFAGVNNGSASLYYDNSKKLETISTGVRVGTSYTAHGFADDFIVANSGDSCGITIAANSSGRSSLHFADAESTNIGFMEYNHSANRFRLYVNSILGLQITDDTTVTLGKAQFGGSSQVKCYGNTGSIKKDALLVLNATASVAQRGAGVSVGGNTERIASFYCRKDTATDSDGGNAFLESKGDLTLNVEDSETGIDINGNGSVDLYYDNVKKFETSSAGATISGNLELSSTYPSLTWTDTNHNSDYRITNNDGQFIIYDVTNSAHRLNINADGNIQIPADNKILYIGAGADLKLYHDGNHSFVSNSGGAGNLVLYGNGTNSIVAQAVAGENSFIGNSNGSVELYYDNSQKFVTSSTGTLTTGQSKVDVDTNLNSDTEYNGQDFGFLVSYDGGDAANSEGNGICFAQKYTSNDASTVRTGAIIGYKQQATGNFGGGLKLKTQKGGANPMGTALQLDQNQHVLIPNDNARLKIGASADLSLYHDGTHSTINNTTGSLRYLANTHYFANPVLSEVMAQFIQNGKCELRFDNAVKFETTSTGGTLTGTLVATGLDVGNSVINRADITVVTDGSRNNGVFLNPGDTGAGNRPNIHIKGAGSAGLSQEAIQVFYNNGSNKTFELDYQGNIEARSLTTTAASTFNGHVDVTGTNYVRFGDNDELQMGFNTNALLLYGSNTFFASGETFRVVNQGISENILWAKHNGEVELYYDNSIKAETYGNGLIVYGRLNFDADGDTFIDRPHSNIIEVTCAAKEVATFIDGSNNRPAMLIDKGQANNDAGGANYNSNGNANDLVVGNVASGNHGITICTPSTGTGTLNFSDGSGAGADAYRGSVSYDHVNEKTVLRAKSGNVALRRDATDTLLATSSGVTITGNVLPEANNSRDLGSTSLRWRNIYTQDLQLSNEAVGDNGIDGTWGDFTIVEGESDLFLKNNRSGKTYKFNLTEVS